MMPFGLLGWVLDLGGERCEGLGHGWIMLNRGEGIHANMEGPIFSLFSIC